VTNEAPLTIDGALSSIVVSPIHDWTILIGDRSCGLLQWSDNQCVIYIFGHVATVPLSAPATAGVLLFIILLLLVAGYYLMANLRHKDAQDRVKLD